MPLSILIPAWHEEELPSPIIIFAIIMPAMLWIIPIADLTFPILWVACALDCCGKFRLHGQGSWGGTFAGY